MDYETSPVASEPHNEIRLGEKYYDEIIPSWHGEFCDNVPNYLFCQFDRKMKKKEEITGLWNYYKIHCVSLNL